MKQNNAVFYDENEYTNVDEPFDVSALQAVEILPNNAVLLSLTIGGSQFTRKVATGSVINEDDIDNALMHVSKNLIDKAYIDGITKLDGAMRKRLFNLGFRPKYLGSGIAIIPLGVLNRTLNELEEYKAEREERVEELLSNYAQAKDDVRLRSPATYDESEYPTHEQIRAQFQVDYTVLSVSFPKILEAIDEELFQERYGQMDAAVQAVERKRMEENQARLNTLAAQHEAQMNEALDEIKNSLRYGFAELVNGMQDKVLGIGTERKQFKAGFIEKGKVFLETFDAKNLANDVELKRLVDSARALLNGVSPDSIRGNIETKIKIERGLKEIKKGLSSMIEPRERSANFS